MRQVFLEKGALSIKEVCEPVLDDHSILVSVHYSFISSGSGLTNIINNNQNEFFHNIPTKVKKVVELVKQQGVDYTAKLIKEKLSGQVFTLGHSCSGTVIGLGKKVKKFRIGDLVACVGSGLANHADVVCVPENLAVHVKNEKFLKSASLTAVGAIALQMVRRANLQLGDSVCVFGLETLGQIIMQLAQLSGCKVIGIDKNEKRINYAIEAGIKYAFNSVQDKVEQSIEMLTSSHGADVVIITPDYENDDYLSEAIKLVRKKGKIIVADNTTINLKKNVTEHKEVDILFSHSYGPGRYDSSYEYQGNDYPYAFVRWTENRNMELFINFLENKQIDVSNLIKDEFNLENLSNALNTLQNNKNLGVILNYSDKKELNSCPFIGSNSTTQLTDFKNKIKVGFIGATKFTQQNLMPLISKIDNVIIDTIIDKDVANTLNVAKSYVGAKALIGEANIFYDNDCNTVMVSHSAEIHTDEVINILEKGKAIFMSKPLVMNFDELNKLKQFFHDNPQALFCVGYHRTFAPFIQKIKKVIENRYLPLMLQYRINAGFIPDEQKMYTEWKPGRVFAQASHIFDLFCYLTEAKPISVSVESLRQSDNKVFPTDNFTAQISFDDGSLCSLMFTSLGHPGLSKERLEIFFDSKTIVMKDFTSLQGFGLQSTFDEKARVPDLGYERLVKSFFESIKKDKIELPISLERLIIAAELTLIIDDLVCHGGGEKVI